MVVSNHPAFCVLFSTKESATSLLAVEISVTKDAVKFATSGDIGSANVMCRQNKAADKVGTCSFPIISTICFSLFHT